MFCKFIKEAKNDDQTLPKKFEVLASTCCDTDTENNHTPDEEWVLLQVMVGVRGSLVG
jgi:hypothetical protein